jgi:hypothetical protein
VGLFTGAEQLASPASSTQVIKAVQNLATGALWASQSPTQARFVYAQPKVPQGDSVNHSELALQSSRHHIAPVFLARDFV